MPKKISIVFHNQSNYDYNSIMKELAEEFKKQFLCWGENTEKYNAFTIILEKEVTRIYKNREITKYVSYILYLTYVSYISYRFMVSSLSTLVNNLCEGIDRIKCKFGHDKN